MTKRIALVLALAAGACGRTNDDRKAIVPPSAPTPAEYQAGEQLFQANCLICHGERGVGTSQGPPLLHQIYAPNHHADASFYRAAEFGATAHHWGFGNMPPVTGVNREDVAQIISYVRWLQREAGIF